MTVLLWYLRYHSLEVEHFDDLDMAIGHASWMLWEGKGAPQLIEVGDRHIVDDELTALINAYEDDSARAVITKSVVAGRIEVRHPIENVWVDLDSYMDTAALADDVGWIRSVVGDARVRVVEP